LASTQEQKERASMLSHSIIALDGRRKEKEDKDVSVLG
jgi:hypothetical protein